MKKLIIVIIALFSLITIHAQTNRFGSAATNNVNVKDTYYQNEERKDIIDATFRIEFTRTDGISYCTGTLINRNTTDNNIGYYFISARHCLYTNNGTGDYVFDENADHYLVLNYQSPTSNNESTPMSNRGIDNYPSTSLTDNGLEYIHKTKLRLVDKFFWGDFALFEILTPIPPHFNVSYAGWEPRRLGSITNIPIGDLYPTALVGIQHPRGDIKKISGSTNMFWLEDPVSSGCYIVTTVIDFLFGWIWGNSASTQVVCNYVDNPWLSVIWTYGLTEPGSSGSGLFGPDNKLIGVLSGGLEFYGKFHANYYNASIKNVLNPSNNIWIDHSGLSGRRISLYDNLELPGGNYPEAYYFPANHYQSENKIVLRARNNIITNKPITILAGSDYEFIAGNSITLKDNFIIKEGATFKASISNSQQNIRKEDNNEQTNLQNKILQRLINIKLPSLKKSTENNVFSNNSNVRIKFYPNPASDVLFIEFGKDAEKIELFTTTGTKVYESTVNGTCEKITVKNYSNGIYMMKVYYKDASLGFHKFVKSK
jgi:V8-like Glu-specific endopeptidase